MSYEMLKTQDVVLKFRFIHNPKNTQLYRQRRAEKVEYIHISEAGVESFKLLLKPIYWLSKYD